jgi:glucose-1-phosphate cytidylyltransferase
MLQHDRVASFSEKPPGDNAVINGGFFVLHPAALRRIEGDDTPWETGPLESLALDGELRAFRHAGFWQPMDTLRDKTTLEALWESGKAPWKVWADQAAPAPQRDAGFVTARQSTEPARQRTEYEAVS